MSSPRAATSVQSRMPSLAAQNSKKVVVRLFCLRSPCLLVGEVRTLSLVGAPRRVGRLTWAWAEMRVLRLQGGLGCAVGCRGAPCARREAGRADGALPSNRVGSCHRRGGGPPSRPVCISTGGSMQVEDRDVDEVEELSVVLD